MSATKKDGTVSLMSLMLILLFIVSTNPASLPAVFLLVVPILIAVTVFTAVRIVIRTFTIAPAHLISPLSGTIAAGCLLVVLLGSLGQLGVQDGLLALLLTSGLALYLRRLYAGRSHPARDTLAS